MSTTIQLRRDAAANWTSANPILHDGEMGVETDTAKFKFGDGATAWNSLGYWAGGALVSPMTTLGDTLYENSTPAVARLAGNTSATKKFLTQTGNGAISAVPAWAGIVLGDIPAGVALLAGATFTGYVAPAVFALSDGTNIALDASKGNSFTVTIAGNRTLSNPTNPVDGQTIRVRVTQGSGGSHTLAYGNAYDFGTAGAPTLSTSAAAVDILGFEYVATLSKWCYLGSGLGF